MVLTDSGGIHAPWDGGGEHGLIEHHWDFDGWEPFHRVVVNQHGDQQLDLDVSGDQGLVTGQVADFGNQRELYIHRGTRDWSAGEVTALIERPSTYTTTAEDVNRPQAGVVLGYELVDGFHLAYVVWYDVFVGNPEVWNISAWRGDGGADLGLAGGGQHIASLRRDLRVIQVERISFLGWVNGYVVQPYHLHGLATGDLVDIAVDDPTFDEAGVAVANADPATGVVQVFDPGDATVVPLRTAGGVIRPAEGHERWFPCWLKARRIGTTISMKVWRSTEPEPAGWQAVVTVTPDEEVPRLPAEDAGGFGVIGAHPHSGSFLRYGSPLTLRRLA